MNTMTINGERAVIAYDEATGLFRGEFLGLNGGADFYADSAEGLRIEGAASLQAFLDVCRERKIEPRKHFSGKFQARLPPALHEDAALWAAAHGKSLNELVTESIADKLRE